MKWDLAEFARRLARMALETPDAARTGESKAPSGPALNTSPKSKPCETPPYDLTARALRMGNRCPKATARYLAVHETLRRGC